jgi:biphenyl 2,3-dioxygenase ferredoxin subunit
VTERERIDVCAVSEVQPGKALRAEASGLVLAVFNVNGEYFVTDDQCTHGPGSLSEGIIEGDIVECPIHMGQFCVRTGEVRSPPCVDPVRAYRTIVADGRVQIEIDW